MEVTYESDEVKMAVMMVHRANIGEAPKGMQWVCNERYDQYVVKAVEVETKKEETPAI